MTGCQLRGAGRRHDARVDRLGGHAAVLLGGRNEGPRLSCCGFADYHIMTRLFPCSSAWVLLSPELLQPADTC